MNPVNHIGCLDNSVSTEIPIPLFSKKIIQILTDKTSKDNLMWIGRSEKLLEAVTPFWNEVIPTDFLLISNLVQDKKDFIFDLHVLIAIWQKQGGTLFDNTPLSNYLMGLPGLINFSSASIPEVALDNHIYVAMQFHQPTCRLIVDQWQQDILEKVNTLKDSWESAFPLAQGPNQNRRI